MKTKMISRNNPSRCPACNSPAPHRHPAVQLEGEVDVCSDVFHLTPTSQNRPEYIAAVEAKRASVVVPQ